MAKRKTPIISPELMYSSLTMEKAMYSSTKSLVSEVKPRLYTDALNSDFYNLNFRMNLIFSSSLFSINEKITIMRYVYKYRNQMTDWEKFCKIVSDPSLFASVNISKNTYIPSRLLPAQGALIGLGIIDYNAFNLEHHRFYDMFISAENFISDIFSYGCYDCNMVMSYDTVADIFILMLLSETTDYRLQVRLQSDAIGKLFYTYTFYSDGLELIDRSRIYIKDQLFPKEILDKISNIDDIKLKEPKSAMITLGPEVDKQWLETEPLYNRFWVSCIVNHNS